MRLRKTDGQIEFRLAGEACSYAVRDFSRAFLEWQLADRQAVFSEIASREIVPCFAAHLPVMTTVNRGGAFPFHTSTKGVGLLPKDEYLALYCDRFRSLIERGGTGVSRDEDKRRRVDAIRDFYRSEHVAVNKLGLLEIFRGNTFRNIQANPLVTLQFTSPGPRYKSFQINGIAEIIDGEDLNFQFIWLARRLFEYESFHIHHPEYAAGYVVWVSEVYDKAPNRGGTAGRRLR